MISIIINPLSGARGRQDLGPARVALARRLLAPHHVDAEVRLSEYPGHAIELARQAIADRATLVCAWGGDGTVNEVARVLAHTDVPLGIIPEGSGNGFARELGLFLGPEQALAVALTGRDRVIDAGEISGRAFFNIAGLGLDAHVAATFNSRAPHRRGFLRYVLLAWRALATYRPGLYRIEANGEQLQARAFMVVLANLRQYGNGAYIAPRADAEDGLLDLVVIEARPMISAFLLTRRLFSRTIDRARGVHTRRLARVTISSETPLLCHVDGETFQAGTQVTAVVRPKALRVRVP